MKIVQSCGSCQRGDLLTFSAGWASPEYHLMSWALSSLQLSKYYDQVVLHADSVSAKMLIDRLGLPYTEVVCDLDTLQKYHSKLWALPKIHTYGKQETPFLHVDADVLIWEPFEDKLLSGDLIAQNEEVSTEYYENIMLDLKSKLAYLPPEIHQNSLLKGMRSSYNAGILGGRDIQFFKLYSSKAFEFVNKNQKSFNNIDVDAFNILYEQYLFYSLAKRSSKVNVLFDEVIKDNEYVGFGDFTDVPFKKRYLHLIGTYKRNIRVCGQLADMLRSSYPEYYYKIVSLFKKNNISLKQDFYFFVDNFEVLDLVRRSDTLKNNYWSDEFPKPVIENVNFNDLDYLSQFNAPFDKLIAKQADRNKDLCKQMTEDLDQFKAALQTIDDQFVNELSLEYLYARDLNSSKYHKTIFQSFQGSSTDYKLVYDPINIKVACKFNWPALMEPAMQLSNEPFEMDGGDYLYIIIPEASLKKYAFIPIDQLDSMIFEISKKPITIVELLKRVEVFFDPEELIECMEDFELLIAGRIKLALEFKIIKGVSPLKHD